MTGVPRRSEHERPTSRAGPAAPTPAGFGGRFMPEALVAALDELNAAWQEAMPDPAFIAEFERLPRLRRRAEPALRGHPALRARRRPDPAQARGPEPHRRPQDPQRARPGAADQADGQEAGDRRDRRRPARRRHGDRRGVPRARLHRLHGRGRHRAPGAQRRPDAAPGGRGHPGDSGSRTLKDAINEALRDWVASVDHTAYLFGTAAGPHPFPSMVRDFVRGIGDEARASAWTSPVRCPTRIAACVGGGSNAIGMFTGFLDDPRSRSTASSPAARAWRPTSTRPRSGPARSVCSTAPAPTSSRTRTARPSSPTRSRPGSTTPGSGPSTPTSPRRPGDVHPGHRRRGDGRDGPARRTEGIIPAIESAHAIAGVMRWPRSTARTDTAGQPVRAGRQGHGHGHRVVRPR